MSDKSKKSNPRKRQSKPKTPQPKPQQEQPKNLEIKQRLKQPKLYTIIGANGTGKSTFVRRLVERYVSQGGRALIITPHDREWLDVPEIDIQDTRTLKTFTGIAKTIFRAKLTMPEIVANYSKGLLIFDDCRVYFRSLTTSDLETLFISRRQREMSQIVVAHGFTAVPPSFFTYSSYFVLFRTKDNIERRKNHILDYEAMRRLQVEVNKISKTKPHFYKIYKTD